MNGDADAITRDASTRANAITLESWGSYQVPVNGLPRCSYLRIKMQLPVMQISET